MGIQSLLRFMKPFIQPVHIKKYAGKRVGIDAYSWLHKGAYSCSLELCQNSQSDKKSRYLEYFMHRIKLLKHYNITPLVVFDGGHLPSKSATEAERSRRRKTNLALAREQLKQGNLSVAVELFQRAVSITPSMAHQLIQILESENIEFVVAPYEADAQLAYLASLEEEQGGIAAIITEDSDLIAYGCQAIVFKMDRYGHGEEILMDTVFKSAVTSIKEKNTGDFVPSFCNFDRELFTGMCVLAGCDFLDSVTGIGIKRAYSLVLKYKNLDRVLAVLKLDKGNQMPEDYSKSFKQAVAVFHHARIYDAVTKSVKPMKPLPQVLSQSLEGELDFLGPEIPPSVATAIAKGRLDPITMEAFDHLPKAANRTCDHDSRTETHVASTEETCFTVFTSHSTRKNTTTVEEQKPTLDKRKYLNEAFALQKLIRPLEVQKTEDDMVKIRSFPDNNPFKKVKLEDVCLNKEDSISPQVSVITNAVKEQKPTLDKRKYLNEVFALQKLRKPVELQKPDNEMAETRAFLDNNPFKKKKLHDVCLDQEEVVSPQVSVVTMDMAVEEQKPALDKRKYSNEASALHKLIKPLEFEQSDDIVEIRDFPDNNPFKKRKLQDVCLDQEDSISSQVSILTNDMESEQQKTILSKRKHSNEAFALHKLLKPLETQNSDDDVVEVRVFPDNNPFKRKQLQDGIMAADIKTEEMLSESQESVTSKFTKKTEAFEAVKRIDMKLKRTTSSKAPQSSKCSILNFFKRL